MTDPVLHLLAGPNGAGKSTLFDEVIDPATHLTFATETVFSHGSKVQLVEAAVRAGYLVTLHVVMVPEALAVARVANRVSVGGHAVPEDKVRERYKRLWPLVASAIDLADLTLVYDNSRSKEPFRVVARFERGALVGDADWPAWTPDALRG